jgi:homoserine kinase
MCFPATSANLGPAFDTAAVALALSLQVTATNAGEFLIEATGRDAAVCGNAEDSLLLQTYRDVLSANGVSEPPALALRIHNEIPVGMGLGSSAAARLAGIALALKYGGLDWGTEQVLAEAIRLEGHPDNAVACWLGGFTVAACPDTTEAGLSFARFEPPGNWSAVLVVQETPLATGKARAALPNVYPRLDAVKNIQSAALLVSAFAQQRGDLLKAAMQDTLHQQYRSHFCPLLEALADMEEVAGVLGVALSGSGPGVLLIVEKRTPIATLYAGIEKRTEHLAGSEIISCDFATAGASNVLNEWARV